VVRCGLRVRLATLVWCALGAGIALLPVAIWGCAIIFPPSVSAIRGTVVDASSPAQGVPQVDIGLYVPPMGGSANRVSIRQTPYREDTTDLQGAFALGSLESGRYRLVVQPSADSGYSALEIEVEIPEETAISLRIALPRRDVAGDVAAVAVAPTEARVEPGGERQFSATVLDTDGQPLDLVPTWLTAGGIGTINDTGGFTAATAEGSGTVIAVVAGVAGAASVTIGADRENRPPWIHALTADNLSPSPGESVTVRAQATDSDGDSITYSWFSGGGPILSSGSTATWVAPDVAGRYTITCVALDGNGGTDAKTLTLTSGLNPYAGFWNGSYVETTPELAEEDRDFGGYSGSIAADGSLVVAAYGEYVGFFTGTGTVSPSGELRARARAGGLCDVEVLGQMAADGMSASGTWSSRCDHEDRLILHVGTWHAERQ